MSGYLPLVGLVAPPPASYLSYSNPYMTDAAHMLTMNSSRDASLPGNGQVLVGGERRDSRHMKSVPPWFIFSNNRSEKVRDCLVFNRIECYNLYVCVAVSVD